MQDDFKIDQSDRIGGYIRFVTNRPVAILMIVVAVIVFGVISYKQLALNLMPDISYPSLTIRTDYTGAAPEEVENMISRPLEQAVGIVRNLQNISSISKAGISDVILEFSWDTDMDDASQDVREKLERVWLPDGVRRPILLRYDPSLDPIIRVGLYSDSTSQANLFQLRRIAEEEIQRSLEEIKGIAAVKVKGGFEEEILIEINERQLAALGLDITQISNRMAQENINLAGGELKEGDTEYLVRTMNEFMNINEIENIIVGELGVENLVEIRIKDIGRVRRTNKERTVITRLNGQESVELEIYKEADANIVRIADVVRKVLFGTPEQQAYAREWQRKQAEADTAKSARSSQFERPDPQKSNFISFGLPTGVQLELLSDQSTFIENAINEVKNTAILGGILAVLILYLFLNKLSTTVIIAVAIPISIIATFGPMYMSEVTLNIMSLGGLALGIGMLVDNSIVVLESIFRCREEGDSILAAARRGTKEVAGAVFASTLTTIAVFFPIVFVEGIAGQIFGDMALTVVFSLITSLMVALFFIPMLASRKIDTAALPGRIHQAKIASFWTLNKLTQLLEKREQLSTPQFLVSAVLLWLLIPVEILAKVALLFLLAGTFLIKIISLLFLVILWPLLAVFKLSGRTKSSYPTWIEHFAESNKIFKLDLSSIWENIFKISAVSNLGNSVRNQWQKLINRSRWYVYLYRPFVFIGALLYYLFRFLMEIVFVIFGRLFILFFLMLYVVVMGLLLFVAVVAKPVAEVAGKIFNQFLQWINNVYPKMLSWSLANKFSVVMIVLVPLFLSIVVFLPQLGSELIPQVHQGQFDVELLLPVGTPVARTDNLIRPIQDKIAAIDGVQKVSEVVGAELTSTKSSEEGEHFARLTLQIETAGNPERAEERVIRQIRQELSNFPDVKYKISHPTLFSFKTPIELEIKGFNLERLKYVTRNVEQKLAQVEGLEDVKSNIRSGNPEIQIKYDRNRLAYFGLNIYQVANLVRNKVLGAVPTEFRDKDRLIDIRVRLREEDKTAVEDLRRLVINPQGEIPIRLADVAEIVTREGPSEIRRIGKQRAAVITANLSGVDLGTVTGEIETILRTSNLPIDFTYEISGQRKEMQTSINSLMLAIALAIFLIYVVMASQFESLIHPFVIMFTIPLALIGVIIVLWLLSVPLSVIVFIGMIMLVGIVVNNAIVLVDYINTLRRRGIEKVEAIIQAGKVRLRPILMTTLTTVLGLLPMALGLGEGAEIRTPLAITVIAGLISSTLLTLIVIPTVYAIFDRGKN